MVSIIIPVFNEGNNIKGTLENICSMLSGKVSAEILCVDGGSTDGSSQAIDNFIKRFSLPKRFHDRGTTLEISTILSPKGRAKQMNHGARCANGQILYFLHADSLPPEDFDMHILTAITKNQSAGCFRMRFDSSHWWLQLAGWFTRFNWPWCRGGDQSLFIKRKVFEEIGGFDEKYVIYEDNILISKLYIRNSFTVLPYTLTTSARRYQEKGVWKLQYHFWMIHLKKRLGQGPEDLYAYYLKYVNAG